MNDGQQQFLALVGEPPARIIVEQLACGEKGTSPSQNPELLGGANIEAASIPGRVCLNGGIDDPTEKASGERAFMDEKQLLVRLPISRRTLGNWKAKGVLPYIKIGRRCLYDWTSVHDALLRRQRGGQ